MKKCHLLMSTAIAGMLALSVSSASLAQEMSGPDNKFWWPDQLDLSALRDQDNRSNPHGESFNYAEEFSKLDLAALKKDIDDVLTTSQDWWPADFGNYGPLFIRMAWHSAGTYRTHDGRGGGDGGQQRFEPLNSWPDNANLDKARRLLWPIKQKYGSKISWGDLMVLTGNVALENMGFETYGFAGGRADDWEPDMMFWGPETEWLGRDRHDADGKLKKPFGATQMGLIYVNPEGPGGKPDPLAAAEAIRQAFGAMAMNDEEIVALIAGGHTFGKMHGAHKPSDCVGAEPAGADIEEQGLGWISTCGKGNAEDTVTSGLEGAWSAAPTEWGTQFLDNLFNFEWVQTKSPAGAIQWIPKDAENAKFVPDAHIDGKLHTPVMLTTDLALKEDPAFRKISERFLDDPDQYQKAFAKAWYKLTHRDMGPAARYLGAEVPDEQLIWQDPLPQHDDKTIGKKEAEEIKSMILETGLSVSDLVKTSWASASSFRVTDMRGGANGARIALAPQKDWAANDPTELAKVLAKLETVRDSFNETARGGRQVSLADVIVLGGAAAIEKAAADAGHTLRVPFKPGRVDASQAQTDIDSFAVLEPQADGFRNYFNTDNPDASSPAQMLVEKADMLDLTVPEMTVLIGGMRVLGANSAGSKHGVLTANPGTLSNDFFVNLLDMSTKWSKADGSIYEGKDRATGETKWTATPVDLVFGSNSELRTIAEVYAYDDSKDKFVNDFVRAWSKVMQLDRFDLN